MQVTPDATKGEIKAAYYGLQKECHPDYTGDDGHQMCVLLNSAYDTLSDPEERSFYDQQLAKAQLDNADGYTGTTSSSPSLSQEGLSYGMMLCRLCTVATRVQVRPMGPKP